MISASIGSHRFESGPTYHFNGSNFAELNRIVSDPTPTIDYINALRGVDATPQEVRDVAASGVVRLAVDDADFRVLEHATEGLLGNFYGNKYNQYWRCYK